MDPHPCYAACPPESGPVAFLMKKSDSTTINIYKTEQLIMQKQRDLSMVAAPIQICVQVLAGHVGFLSLRLKAI